MKKIFGPKTSSGVVGAHGTVEKFFHGKARKQWIPKLSTMPTILTMLNLRRFRFHENRLKILRDCLFT